MNRDKFVKSILTQAKRPMGTGGFFLIRSGLDLQRDRPTGALARSLVQVQLQAKRPAE